MLIQLLVDNKESWIVPYARDLCKQIKGLGHTCKLIHKHENVTKGDVLCLLSCEKIFRNLHLNKYNLVVHESDLPNGRGWSPLTWQILEGKNKIPVTLFEATEEVDAGDVYTKEYIELDGHELLNEIKHKQGIMTNKIILDFVKRYPNVEAKPQEGEPTFYQKRTPADSKLDIDKSIREQFNHLRICDNNRYPAFFEINGITYVIKIEKK